MFKLLTFMALFAGPAYAGHEFADANLANGEHVYAQNCASCHGADLEGQPNWRTADENGILPAPPHDETGHTWHHDSRFLFSYIKYGGQRVMEAQGLKDFTSGMPAFEDSLTDQDIIDVLGYIHSTWDDEIKAAQASRTHGH